MEDNTRKEVVSAAFCAAKLLVGVCSDELNSDDENEEQFRIENYVEIVVPNFSDNQFRQHFRLNRSTFEQLLQIIAEEIPDQSKWTILLERQLLSVLWLLATPDSYR